MRNFIELALVLAIITTMAAALTSSLFTIPLAFRMKKIRGEDWSLQRMIDRLSPFTRQELFEQDIRWAWRARDRSLKLACIAVLACLMILMFGAATGTL